MRTQRSRARSHAHAHKHRRAVVHFLVAAIAVASILLGARLPQTSRASTPPSSAAPLALSGVTGLRASTDLAVLRPGTSQVTHHSVTALTVRADVASVRAAAAVSPMSSFSSGVAVAAAA